MTRLGISVVPVVPYDSTALSVWSHGKKNMQQQAALNNKLECVKSTDTH